MGHKKGHYEMSMGEKEKDTPGNFNEKDSKTIKLSKQGKMAQKLKGDSVYLIKKNMGLEKVNVLQFPDAFLAKNQNPK